MTFPYESVRQGLTSFECAIGIAQQFLANVHCDNRQGRRVPGHHELTGLRCSGPDLSRAHRTDFVQDVRRARIYLAIQAALSLYPSRSTNGHRNGSWRRDVVHSSHPRYIGRSLSFFVKRTDRAGVASRPSTSRTFFKIEFIDEYTSRIFMNDTNTVSYTTVVLGCAFDIGPCVLTEVAQRITLREKASNDDFLAMYPVSFLFVHLTNVSNDPPRTPVVNTLSCCVHTPLWSPTICQLDMGLVDPNRQEFESFENWSVGFWREQ